MTEQRYDWIAPGLEAFTDMAALARDALPEPFRTEATRVPIQVADFAPDDILRDMQIEDPFELTGLYDGIPLTQKSVMDQPGQPDVIWLFRRPILDEWAARGNEPLSHLVAHVYIHELAHHFGWSDDDIARIDPWWD